MRILFALICLAFAASVCAQKEPSKPKPLPKITAGERLGIIYAKELTFGLGLHTNGWQLTSRLLHQKKFMSASLWHFELSEIYSIYETSAKSQSGSSFSYGKQNSLFLIKAGLGARKYLSEKAKKKGVAIGIEYEIGPTLGLLKPYYLDFTNIKNQIEQIKYSNETKQYFLDKNQIDGYSGLVVGFDEVKPRPGAHAKLAVLFDFGAFDAFSKVLEFGLKSDVFFTPMPIMIDKNSLPVYLNLYLNFHLGKRWN